MTRELSRPQDDDTLVFTGVLDEHGVATLTMSDAEERRRRVVRRRRYWRDRIRDRALARAQQIGDATFALHAIATLCAQWQSRARTRRTLPARRLRTCVRRPRAPRRHRTARHSRRAATDSGSSSDGDDPPARRLRRRPRGPPHSGRARLRRNTKSQELPTPRTVARRCRSTTRVLQPVLVDRSCP